MSFKNLCECLTTVLRSEDGRVVVVVNRKWTILDVSTV